MYFTNCGTDIFVKATADPDAMLDLSVISSMVPLVLNPNYNLGVIRKITQSHNTALVEQKI